MTGLAIAAAPLGVADRNLLKLIAIAFCLASFLAACSLITPRLDRVTGVSKAERCLDYQDALAAARAVQAQFPSEERSKRIALYQALVEATCGGVTGSSETEPPAPPTADTED